MGVLYCYPYNKIVLLVFNGCSIILRLLLLMQLLNLRRRCFSSSFLPFFVKKNESLYHIQALLFHVELLLYQFYCVHAVRLFST